MNNFWSMFKDRKAVVACHSTETAIEFAEECRAADIPVFVTCAALSVLGHRLILGDDISATDIVVYGSKADFYGSNPCKVFTLKDVPDLPRLDTPEEPQVTKVFMGKRSEKCYGVLGTPTKFRDCNGEPLFVGDFVELIEHGNEVPSTRNFVVDLSGEQFIMGIRGACDGVLGVTRGWYLRKNLSFKTIPTSFSHEYLRVVDAGSVPPPVKDALERQKRQVKPHVTVVRPNTSKVLSDLEAAREGLLKRNTLGPEGMASIIEGLMIVLEDIKAREAK